MSESFSLEIKSSFGNYGVRIGNDVVSDHLEEQASILLIDKNLRSYLPKLNNVTLIEINAQESEKSLDTVASVIEKLRESGANRTTHLIAIGGGIVQDIATMTASIYMRGITWTYLPTTLLGMVDSCVGGKSSINVGKFKNIAGNFYPPTEVLIDTKFCQTLALAERIAGLCEAVKICYADTGDSFEQYLKLIEKGNPVSDHGCLTEIVALTLSTKKRFIEEDEFDNGVRLLLNFGHTFGHALEGASNFKITHGIAVGLGMVAAYVFSIKNTPCLSANVRVQALLLHVRWLISQVPSVRQELLRIDIEDAVNRFKSDKKHKNNEFAIIAYDANGYLERQLIPINDATEARIADSFASIGKCL